MLQIIRKKDRKGILKGFTLIELLVSVTILGLISLVAIQFVYDSLTFRSKQQMIEDSSDSFRLMVRLITNAVIEARSVDITPDLQQIRMVGSDSCKTIKFDETGGIVLLSEVNTIPCSPPDTGFADITGEGVLITGFIASPAGNSVGIVNLKIEGKSYDPTGEHDVSYETSISPRNKI